MAGRSGVHAVVWRARETPPDLARALTQQGITWEEAGGPFDALARVLAARQARSRPRVLLIVEPASLPEADVVRTALQQFDPATGCWAYRAGASPRLAPLPPAAKQPEPEVIVRPRPGPAAPRSELRLAGEAEPPGQAARGGRHASASHEPEAPRPASRHPEPEETPQSPRSILTPEELAMLLADEPD